MRFESYCVPLTGCCLVDWRGQRHLATKGRVFAHQTSIEFEEDVLAGLGEGAALLEGPLDQRQIEVGHVEVGRREQRWVVAI